MKLEEDWQVGTYWEEEGWEGGWVHRAALGLVKLEA